MKPAFVLSEELEAEAWTNWVNYSDNLTAEGSTQRPMLEKYVTTAAET